MLIKIEEYYPTSNFGEIVATFEVFAKDKIKGELVVAEFIEAVHLNDKNMWEPLTKKDLEESNIFDYLQDDAIEKFYDYLRSAEYQSDLKNDAADSSLDLIRENDL